MQCSLSQVSGDNPKVGNCSLSFQDFYDVGLTEECPAFLQELKNDTEKFDIQKAIKSVDGQHPALVKMDCKQNKDGTKRAGHCIAVFPDGVFVDVQKRRYWEPEPNVLKEFIRISVWKVQVKIAKDFEKKCGLQKCKLECIVCPSVRADSSGDLKEVKEMEQP